MKLASSSFQTVFISVLVTVPLLLSCGLLESDEEQNLKDATQLKVLGKTINVSNDFFDRNCNFLYFNFLKTRSHNECVAIYTTFSVDALKFKSQDSSIDITAGRTDTTLTIDGTTYNCYLFEGDIFTSTGKQVYALGPIFLTKSTAFSPYDLKVEDVDFVGIKSSEVCDVFY